MLSKVLLPCLALFGGAFAASTSDWRSRNIYFVLTDRIARGSSDNGGGSCGDLGNYCGGTFEGLESKLDYIKGMGFDAIWITPVVSNKPRGYHGYWAEDLNSIESHLGSSSDLKSLVNAAHDKDMYMMLDVVANHMGPGDVSYNSPSPLNQQSAYHSQCNIDYSNQQSVHDCWVAGSLPDIDTSRSDIRSLYKDWVQGLVGEYGFDGIRVDTARQVPRDYWPGFVLASGVASFGEYFDGDPNLVAEYDGVMSGFLNYPLWYPLKRFYQQEGSSQDLVDMFDTISYLFADPTAMPTFIDNHDNKRFLNQKGDTVLLKNALAYVILGRGIPIVYYGTEQGFNGGDDPYNREALWSSGFDTSSDLYQFISLISSARRDAGGLPDDDHKHLYVEDGAYAWSRVGGDLVVLTTNHGSGHYGQECLYSQVNNASWEDLLGSGSYTSDGNGLVCVDVKNGMPVVLQRK